MCSSFSLAIISISESTFHLLLMMLSIRDWYFFIFVVIISEENLSLQYVNSMKYILRMLSTTTRGFDWYGNPLKQIMSDLYLALQ